MPWIEQHRQWHSRGSRSAGPRELPPYLKKRAQLKRKRHIITQDYPKGPRNKRPYSRRWGKTGRRALRKQRREQAQKDKIFMDRVHRLVEQALDDAES